MTVATAFAFATLIGFASAAPVGPVNLMCIQRTLARGWWPGYACGLAAAAAEACYAAAAVLALSAAVGWIEAHRSAVQLTSGALLLAFGLWTWFSRPIAEPGGVSARAGGVLGAAASAFLLAASNPAPLLSMGLGLGLARAWLDTTGTPNTHAELAGLVAGSIGWWTVLSAVTARLRARVTPRAQERFRRAVGAALGTLRVLALAEGVRTLA